MKPSNDAVGDQVAIARLTNFITEFTSAAREQELNSASRFTVNGDEFTAMTTNSRPNVAVHYSSPRTDISEEEFDLLVKSLYFEASSFAITLESTKPNAITSVFRRIG